MLGRKCYAHFNKNAKQAWMWSIQVRGKEHNLYLGEGLKFSLNIFFWKYGFELTCFSLCGTIFYGDVSLGSEMEERGLNDPRLTSGHYGAPGKTESRNWSFDTNVRHFSYSAPCEAQTFTTMAWQNNRAQVTKKTRSVLVCPSSKYLAPYIDPWE